MGKINYLRVFIGGLIAAMVFIVTELFIEELAGILWDISETALLREYFPQALQGKYF